MHTPYPHVMDPQSIQPNHQPKDPTPSQFSRRHDLDALRAIAMLLGIGLHGALCYAVDFPWPVRDPQQHWGFTGLFFAIHGFRMPLFFLVSGFFTAMLWRKRGLKALLTHRFKRIFLPLVLGIITIVPLINLTVASIMHAEPKQELKQAANPELVKETEKAPSPNELSDTSLFSAIQSGDEATALLLLNQNSDLLSEDSEFGLPPLAYASLMGLPSVVSRLVELGADPNARSRNGGTPLHCAAFTGEAEVFALLIKAGADPEAKDNKELTPALSALADDETTRWIFGILRIKYDRDKVTRGRAAIFDQLRSLGVEVPEASQVESLNSDNRSATEKQLDAFIEADVFHHLWFLWFLCWLVLGFSVYALAASALGITAFPRWLIRSPLCLIWLLPLTYFFQLHMVEGAFGPDTSLGWLPVPHVLGYYAVFFGFGALLFDVDASGDAGTGRFWWLMIPLALVIAPLGIDCLHGGIGLRENILPSQEWYRHTGVAVQVLYAWLMTFGCIGLFRTFCSGKSRVMRYVSDSSYWLYLAHMPLIFWGQWWLTRYDWSAGVKFAVLCCATTVLLLLSYECLIRYSPIGTLLNGKRTR